jgi:hypothetical protein
MDAIYHTKAEDGLSSANSQMYFNAIKILQETSDGKIKGRQKRCQKETGKIDQGKEESQAGEEIQIGAFPFLSVNCAIGPVSVNPWPEPLPAWQQFRMKSICRAPFSCQRGRLSVPSLNAQIRKQPLCPCAFSA